MPIFSVFAPLLKSRFFVIYYGCVTLADSKRQRFVLLYYWATPQAKIKDFCLLPLHRGAFGCIQ